MSYIFPKLSDEKEFENLVRDWFKIRTKNNNFQNFGRKGQSQYGIDSFGDDFSKNEFVVVQCKNYTTVKTLSELKESIKEELKKFDDSDLPFKEKTEMFYFVTSLDNDVEGQKYSESINNERVKIDKSKFKIIYWQELIDELRFPQYEEILFYYFTKQLGTSKFNISKPLYNKNKETISLKYQETTGFSHVLLLEKMQNEIFANEEIKSGFDLSIGLVGNGESLEGEVDIQINFEEFYTSEDCETNWNLIIKSIKHLSKIIKDLNSVLSRKIIIHQKKIQPSLAFLFGYGLNKQLSNKNFQIIFKDSILSNKVDHLLMSDSGISEV